MKRTLVTILTVLVLAGCKTSPVVVEGVINGYNGTPLTISITKGFVLDTIKVTGDGSYSYSIELDEPSPATITLNRSTRVNTFLLPGKKYRYDLDMTSDSAEWVYSGKYGAEIDFNNYMREVYSHIDFKTYVFPDTFAEFDAMWDERTADARQRLSGLSDRKAVRYFEENLNASNVVYRFGYVWQMQKRGQALDSDEGFNEFFDSIDLNNPRICRSLLNSMITVKSQIYCDTITPSVRQLRAIDELAPSAELRDSLSRKYIAETVRDSKIVSAYEGEVIMAAAEKLIADTTVINDYRKRIDKAVSLLRGSKAIDFEMIDSNGRTIRLSDFKGKAVYIDFWATWCIPCCLQIPHMKVLAEKYSKDKRIACISVSFDDSMREMADMILKDKPSWPQYSTADGGKAIMDAYCFRAIPRFMLIDKEGRIVTPNAPRPQSLEEVSKLIDEIL